MKHLLVTILVLTISIAQIKTNASCLYYLYLQKCTGTNIGDKCHHDYYYNTSYNPATSGSVPCIARTYMTTFCIDYAQISADIQDDVQCYACEDPYFLWRKQNSATQYKYDCQVFSNEFSNVFDIEFKKFQKF